MEINLDRCTNLNDNLKKKTMVAEINVDNNRDFKFSSGFKQKKKNPHLNLTYNCGLHLPISGGHHPSSVLGFMIT